jgi:hypothetical protein
VGELEYRHEFEGLYVTYKTVSGLVDWIYWHLIHTTRNYRQLQPYCWTTHFTVHRYTRTRVLSLLATKFYPSHCNFKSHMKFSFHHLIYSLVFLLIHLGLPSPELDPVLHKN